VFRFTLRGADTENRQVLVAFEPETQLEATGLDLREFLTRTGDWMRGAVPPDIRTISIDPGLAPIEADESAGLQPSYPSSSHAAVYDTALFRALGLSASSPVDDLYDDL
jgi:hypothetical protein